MSEISVMSQEYIISAHVKVVTLDSLMVFLLPFHDSKDCGMQFIFQEIGKFDVDVTEIPVSNTYHLPQAVNWNLLIFFNLDQLV